MTSPAEIGAALAGSRRLLVTGFRGASVEAVRIAVAIADRLGGVCDPDLSPVAVARLRAYQEVGDAVCSLAEMRGRADRVLFWRAEPGDEFRNAWLPNPRPDGSPREMLTLGATDLPRGGDAALVVNIRGRLAGRPVEADPLAERIADFLAAAKYGVVLRGDAPLSAAGAGAAEVAAQRSLSRLVQSLNATTRCSEVDLPSPAGVAEAMAVLTWQTGFPQAVCFAGGSPRYRPDDATTAAVLAGGEADRVLVVGGIAEPDRLADAPEVIHVEADEHGPLGGTRLRSDGLPLRSSEADPLAERLAGIWSALRLATAAAAG